MMARSAYGHLSALLCDYLKPLGMLVDSGPLRVLRELTFGIVFTGSVQLTNAARLFAQTPNQLEAALEQGRRQIILDCKALKIVNSEGLEALLWAIETAQGSGGLVKIASLGETPKKVFEITQFDRVFEIYEDVIAALKSL